MLARALLLLFVSVIGIVAPASAQQREVPYWATVRASELNMRVGPSADYRIDWVYHRPGLPVKVIRKLDGWRLIEDPDGARGWVVVSLLSPDRGAIVIGHGETALRVGPSAGAAMKWRIAPGVSGALGDCDAGWCELTVGKRSGWIEAARLWGAGEP